MTSTEVLGPVMIDLAGTSLTTAEHDRLLSPATGGIILFRRNYESPEQITDLIAGIRAIRPTLLVAVDHEGGRVQRFRDGYTRLPSVASYQLHGGAELAEKAGWLMAAELRAADVDFSFAPVLDVECGISQVIGDRAFGTDPATVAELAQSFAAGMRRAGMSAVGKHFPGHGGVEEDSHVALPIDRRSLTDLQKLDLIPFNALLAAGIEGIMPAHVIYAAVDERPAGFSPFWLQEVLRRRMGFSGAIFSDDLSMAGAEYAGSYSDRARLALAAGCDMVLVCNAPEAAEEVLESLSDLSVNPCQPRLQAMRGRGRIDRARLRESPEWQETSQRLAAIGPTGVQP
ncbi:MAG: beta-N-acetylhexosaminidase [Methylococcaceae bacterium]|jgi:beta-N-acetylhexosaminidase